MTQRKDIALVVSEEVVLFVRANIAMLKMADPVPVLIYGRFDAEKENHFRVSLSERAELQKSAADKGFIVNVAGLGELFVSVQYEPAIKNKTMKLMGDTVEFV